jgi:hypothetical protein
MKRAMDVYFELRRKRFNERDAQQIAGIYKAMVADERDFKPWGIASAVCARTGMHPEVWHEELTRVFSDKELSRR